MSGKKHNWLHRDSMIMEWQFREEKLPLPVSNYVKDPDLSAVEGVPTMYWKLGADDKVLPMDQNERDVVDRAAEDLEVEMKVNRIMSRQKSFRRALVLLVIDEINKLRAKAGMAPITNAQAKDKLRRTMKGL